MVFPIAYGIRLGEGSRRKIAQGWRFEKERTFMHSKMFHGKLDGETTPLLR
jgi:hypothetical protein